MDAVDLCVGDVLLRREGGPARITSLRLLTQPQLVYNFAVDDLHSFAIGKMGVLVHNSCGDYEVDYAQNLRKNPRAGTSVHHAPQSRRADSLVANFNRANKVGKEPAIRLPNGEHALISSAMRTVSGSARSLLAEEILLLKKFTKEPNAELFQLIKLSKDMHYADYLPIHRMVTW